MGSAGTQVAPEIANKSLAFIASACGDKEQKPHQIWPCSPECPPSPKYDIICTAKERYPKGSSLSSSSCGNRLPRVLEESESFSAIETSALDTSNTTSNASFTSSTQSSLHRGPSERAFNGHGHGKRVKQKKAWKRRSLISMLSWPLKKVRDGYVSCMMSMDGVGDLSGMAQGANFAASSKYFADLPLSKTDSQNYG